MRKKSSLLLAILFVCLQLFAPTQVQAASCVDWGLELLASPPHDFAEGTISEYNLNIKNLNNPGRYKFILKHSYNQGLGEEVLFEFTPTGGIANFLITKAKYPQALEQSTGVAKGKTIIIQNSAGEKCELWNYRVTNNVVSASCTITYEQKGFKNPGCLDTFTPVTIKVDNFVKNGGPLTANERIFMAWQPNDSFGLLSAYIRKDPYDIGPGKTITKTFTPPSAKENTIIIMATEDALANDITWCTAGPVNVIAQPCSDAMRLNAGDGSQLFELCTQAPDQASRDKCTECAGKNGVWTAVGCIEGSAKGIATTFFSVGMGIAGGLALLMILVAAFMFSTSQGEPKRTSEAKEIMQAAVIGLLFIIFSITILQFIGVTILHIPGFGE